MGIPPNPETLAAPLVATGWSVPTTLAPVTRGAAGVPELSLKVYDTIARILIESAPALDDAEAS